MPDVRASPGWAGCPEQVGAGPVPRTEPQLQQGSDSQLCPWGRAAEPPTSGLRLPDESRPGLPAGEGGWSPSPVCLPVSRGMSVRMSSCAARWTRPLPTRTSSTPSKQRRMRPTRPPVPLSLPSRWASALAPSLHVEKAHCLIFILRALRNLKKHYVTSELVT